MLRLSIVLETSWNACDRFTTALIVLFTRVLTVDCNCIFLATLDHTLSNGKTCLRRLFSKTPKMIKGKNWSFFSFFFTSFQLSHYLRHPVSMMYLMSKCLATIYPCPRFWDSDMSLKVLCITQIFMTKVLGDRYFNF